MRNVPFRLPSVAQKRCMLKLPIITLVARDKNLLVAEFQKSTRHIGKKCLALVNVQSLLPY